jgi:chemotaxis methyl-accepting protein methylase
VDIDPRALKTAAEGHYDAAALVELPLDLRERFVEALDKGFRICESVRRRVAFSRFDLSALAPADNERARYDLICCRNVLIYFQREVQERTLQALTQRIRAQGFLCLGEAEWPAPALAAALQPLPHQTRLFRLLRTLEHP